MRHHLLLAALSGTSSYVLGKTPLQRRSSLPRRKLGSMEVTEVCAGTMTWGSFVAEEAEAHAELDKFVELGVNFIDTAEIYPVAFNYGKTTEVWIGNWLEARVASGAVRREDFYIATKCNPAGIGSPGGAPHGFEADKLEASARASIERMKCDYIDLYYLHFPSRKGFNVFGWTSYGSPARYADSRTTDGSAADFEAQVLGIKRLLDLGLIKHWGLSNENAYGVTMFCLAADRLGVPRPVCIQNDLSLNERTFDNDVAEACHHFGVQGLPYGALSGGALTGKYLRGQASPNARHNSQPDFQGRYNGPAAVEAIAEYQKLADEYGISLTDLALAWARDRWYNFGVITGTTSVAQVEECVAAFRLEPLPAELNARVDEIHERFRSPTAAFADKDALSKAAWLAKEPECVAA